MIRSHRPFDDDRARLALEQALLLVNHLQHDEQPDFGFIRDHAITIVQLVDVNADTADHD